MNKIAIFIIALWVINISQTAAAETIDIFVAAREGNSRDIKTYAQNGKDVNVTNSKNYTPFILATYNGHIEAAETLLQVGANACALDNKGNNALMSVAFKGYQQVAQWLVEKTQCGVNHQNYAGQTSLMMASLFGRQDIIKLLLEHGADPQLTDHQGNTATKLAQAQGLSHVVEIIKFHLQ
ncbi:MAG: ankyrin repeat domain-containing protein [Methylococcales bacterium]